MKKGDKIGNLGFVLHDAVKRTHILTTLKFLEKSQKWSEEQMYEYRLSKLRTMLAHSYNHVPYYTELFNSHGISPDDIRSLNDINKIPILTKEIARENQQRLISGNASSRFIKKGKTGGTTGIPVTVLKDTNDRSFTWASYYRWYNWMGLTKEDRVLTFWGSRTVLKPSLKYLITDKLSNILENNRLMNSFTMSDENINDFYLRVKKTDPVLIKGYLSALILLAKHMQANALPPNKRLKAVSSTSETLLPVYRDLLESAFRVPVFDQYGCGEVSAISYECAQHNGLHINEEHVIVEAVNNENENIIDEKGRLIVTSLDNFVMPFIRFENGDMATLFSRKCSCGINSQMMSSIDGRTIETITLKNGGKVHGVFFTDLLYEIGITTDIISRFQIFQYKSGAIDFILETKNEIPDSTIKNLESKTLRFFDSVKVKVVPFIIPEENGKFKYIKNEI